MRNKQLGDIMRENHRILRMAIYVLLFILAALLESTPGLTIRIFSATPILALPMVVCAGMFEREAAGGYLGLFAGLLYDLSGVRPPGFYALIFMFIGCVGGLLVSYIMHNNFYAAIMITLLSLGVYLLAEWVMLVILFGQNEGRAVLEGTTLRRLLLTAGMILPFYFLVRRINKKTRQINET